VSDITVKVTLPQAADLLLRWFKNELNDKNIRVDTMKFLRACGKIPPDLTITGKSDEVSI
jgi:hypothetical protein